MNRFASWTWPSSPPKQRTCSQPRALCNELVFRVQKTYFTLSSRSPHDSPLEPDLPRSFLYSCPLSLPIHTYHTTLGMIHALGTMSAPTPSLIRAFSQFGQPQHPIEQRESKREAVHRKRGRSLSTPSFNTREWHQFRMLDATTPHLSPCDPTLSGRPRSASLNPSPVITCTGPSLGDRSYERAGCSQDQVETTESSGSPAAIPDEQVLATEGLVVGHGLEHLIKRTRPNAGPLPAAGGILESLLKRRDAPRCFFSLAELHAMSSFEDSSDDGGYQVPLSEQVTDNPFRSSDHFSSFEVPLDPFTLIAISSMPNTPGTDTKQELGLSYFKAHSR